MRHRIQSMLAMTGFALWFWLSTAGATSASSAGAVVAAELTYAGGRFSPCLSLDFLVEAGERLGHSVAGYAEPVVLENMVEARRPLFLLTGELPFSLSETERQALRDVMTSSAGFLVAFSGCGNPLWAESFRAEFAKFAPELMLRPIPSDHRLVPMEMFSQVPDAILGIWSGGRLRGVFVDRSLNASDRVHGCCCCQGDDWDRGHEFLVDLAVRVLSERPEHLVSVPGANDRLPVFLDAEHGGGLVAALSDTDWRVRAWALRLAVRLGLPDAATSSVISRVEADPSPLVRRLGIDYLGQRFKRESAPTLLRLFREDDARLRPYLAMALVRLAPTELERELTRLPESAMTAPLLAALQSSPTLALERTIAALAADDRMVRLAAHFLVGLAVGADAEVDDEFVAGVLTAATSEDVLWLAQGALAGMTVEFSESAALRRAVSERLKDGGLSEAALSALVAVSERLGDKAGGGAADLDGTPPLAADESVSIVFFSSVGCRLCRIAQEMLEECIAEAGGRFRILEYPIRKPDAVRLNEALCRYFGVPERDRLRTPMIFAPAGALVPEEIEAGTIRELLRTSQSLEPDSDWHARLELDLDAAAESVTRRFEGFDLGVILVAGLLDSVNPCAFATLIFLVSYLHIARRSRRETVQVCLAFVAGVFTAYFLIGLGAASVLNRLRGVQVVAEGVRILAAVLALVVMVLSFRDGILCLRGRMGDMALQLPDGLKSRIRAMIRSGARMRHFVAGSFLIGAVVSLLELACTGQVYAPTLVYMMNSGRAGIALGYLVAYNLAFVAPLLVILLLAVRGLGSEALTRWLKRHAAAVKFATGTVFLVLFLVLLW